MVEGFSRVEKPLVIIVPRVFQNNPDIEKIRADFINKLNDAGIPTYPTAERAACTARKIYHYLQFMQSHGIEV
jgi:hypothetical protein